MKLLLFYKNLLAENQKNIKMVIIWFSIWFLVGTITGALAPTVAQNEFENSLSAFNHIQITFIELFKRNLFVALCALFFGVLLGLWSLAFIAYMGFTAGLTYGWFTSLPNASSWLIFYIVSIVPHGIFEMSAFIIAASFGVRLGWAWKIKDRFALKKCIDILPLLLLLLAIAATIESTASLWLAETFVPQ